jgi:hypothetical protein
MCYACWGMEELEIKTFKLQIKLMKVLSRIFSNQIAGPEMISLRVPLKKIMLIHFQFFIISQNCQSSGKQLGRVCIIMYFELKDVRRFSSF